MRTRETLRRARGARRGRGRFTHRLAWFSGGSLVCLGALSGAFGTVAWLTVLCAPFPAILLGVLALGAMPVVLGGALLWAGLSLLEAESARSRVRGVPEAYIVEAARAASTAKTIALRLGLGDVAEVERRLDDLVVHEALVLEVNEEGDVLYREPERGAGC
jgi:hypothetical protein